MLAAFNDYIDLTTKKVIHEQTKRKQLQNASLEKCAKRTTQLGRAELVDPTRSWPLRSARRQ